MEIGFGAISQTPSPLDLIATNLPASIGFLSLVRTHQVDMALSQCAHMEAER